MITIEPDMKLDRQIRKGMERAAVAASEGDHQKTCYIIDLVKHMVLQAATGSPSPWSHYEPMIDEEFS